MAEYITKDEARNAVDERIGALLIYHSSIAKVLCVNSIKKHIDTIKPADVVPVIHGKWIQQKSILGMTNYYECSECGRVIWLDKEMQELDDFPFCHCGAKMDLED